VKPSDLLDDPRVTSFWDDRKIAGRWFDENVTKLGARERNPDRIEWDSFVLFSPQAQWVERPPDHVSWGRPLVQEAARLRGSRSGSYERIAPSGFSLVTVGNPPRVGPEKRPRAGGRPRKLDTYPESARERSFPRIHVGEDMTSFLPSTTRRQPISLYHGFHHGLMVCRTGPRWDGCRGSFDGGVVGGEDWRSSITRTRALTTLTTRPA
jgi:hypothetical protein